MKKGYYIFGVLLVGVAGFLLYKRIKKGVTMIDFVENKIEPIQDGSHLEPPMEVAF